MSEREPNLKFDTAWVRYPLPADERGVGPGRISLGYFGQPNAYSIFVYA